VKHFDIWDRVIVTDKNGNKHKAMVTERIENTYKLFYSETLVTGTSYWPASSLTRDVEPSPSER
jgi:hypothetical protein